MREYLRFIQPEHFIARTRPARLSKFNLELYYCIPPIVIVTDRKQLDEQIHGTFKTCGFPDPIPAQSRKHLEELLSNPRGKTIMTTIQKFGSEDSHINTQELNRFEPNFISFR